MDFLRFSIFYCQIRNVKSMSEYEVSVTSLVPWRGGNVEQEQEQAGASPQMQLFR